MPPAKARIWTSPRPSQALPAPRARAGTRSGITIPIVAPRDAPAAVPMMYGSAIGLRRTAWNTVPAHASPAPTTIAPRTRGRRRSITIVSRLSLTPDVAPTPNSRCTRTRSTPSGAMATLPRPIPRTSAARRTTTPPPSTSAARVSAGPRTSGRGATPARIGLVRERVGVDVASECLQPVHDAWPRARDHDVLGHDDHPLILRGRHSIPSRASRHALGRDRLVVGRVPEQDQLGVGGHQVLDLDRRRECVAG